MYKFPHGNRQAIVTTEHFFDAIDLPPFSVEDFAPGDQPKAVQDYCSYVLSTFNYQGIRPRGMLLRMDDEGVYYPTLELLTADNKQGAASDVIMRVGYVIGMDDALNITVANLMHTRDAKGSYHRPAFVSASLYVTHDAMFSKRSGTVVIDLSAAATGDYAVSMPNIIYSADADECYPVRVSSSMYHVRSRPTSGGELLASKDGVFRLVPDEAFMVNLLTMGIVDDEGSVTFSIGLNGITTTSPDRKYRVTDVFDAQINGLVVPVYVREYSMADDVGTEEFPDGNETHEEWQLREQAINLPTFIPVLRDARVDKFVDPALIAPWTVKTPLGEYQTNFLKLGSGNLLDVCQFWGEHEQYRVDAVGAVGEILLSITHAPEDAKPVTEIHRVKLRDMRYHLPGDARQSNFRRVGDPTIAIVGCQDFTGKPSVLIDDTGLQIKVAFTGNLNLDSGGWALNGQSVVPLCKVDGRELGYKFKVVGWYPELRLVRKDPVITAKGDDDQKIPPHLVEVGYGVYLAALVEGQEAMPRASFANASSQKLHDMKSVINFARGLGASHRQKEKVADNPHHLTREDLQSHGLKVSGTLLMRADSVTVQSEKPLTTTSKGITLTGDPVFIAPDDVDNEGKVLAELVEDGVLRVASQDEIMAGTTGEFAHDPKRMLDAVMNMAVVKPACIDTIGAMLWFYHTVATGIMRPFPEWHTLSFDDKRKAYPMSIDGILYGFNDDEASVRRLYMLRANLSDVSAAEWDLMLDTMTPNTVEVVRKGILADLCIRHDSAVTVNPAYFCGKTAEILGKERYVAPAAEAE